MHATQPGEVWLVDLGIVAKTRPCLLLSDFPADDELALLLVVPHTTSIRSNRWELVIPKRFLKPGAFHLQQIQNVPVIRLERKLGILAPDEFRTVKTTLTSLLKLDQ